MDDPYILYFKKISFQISIAIFLVIVLIQEYVTGAKHTNVLGAFLRRLVMSI